MKDVAKKTLVKIEKEQEKLDALVAKRDEFTESYQTKLAVMNDGINEQKKVIAELREQEKAEKLSAFASLAGKRGVSVDDLLAAMMNVDFYSVQEKLEGKSGSLASNSVESVEVEYTNGTEQ